MNPAFNKLARVRVMDHFSDLYMREGIVTGGREGRLNVTIDGAVYSFRPGCLLHAEPIEEH